LPLCPTFALTLFRVKAKVGQRGVEGIKDNKKGRKKRLRLRKVVNYLVPGFRLVYSIFIEK
jgi:hypothetical protein